MTKHGSLESTKQNLIGPMIKNERLSKVLARAGVASRRHAEEIISEGRVKVNGVVCLVPQTMVSLLKDEILVDGKKIRKEEEKVYYMLHKPTGYVCTNEDGKKRRVIDLFEEKSHRLYTVGRLDKDTSGLIIVTNDGKFAHSIMHPTHGVEKEYLVKVDKEVLHSHLVAMSEGTIVEGSFVKPVAVRKVRKATFKVILRDGRKREVRLIAEKAGLEVLELKRIRIGQLVLGSLPYGAYRPLTDKEKELLVGI